jgi:succinate dehydrogenase / fumarate reductase flavoprotein subunit
LTRDHVARKIVKEVKAGRGSPHGGVFLDIAWIKEHLSDAEGHIRKKLPSMYHQFKELAGVDITKEVMEVGPTTHYVMGGIKVDAETQMSRVPGLFACGECGGGLHGANRLGGNSLSDLVVFGRIAGASAAKFASEHGDTSINEDAASGIEAVALAPLERSSGESPYAIQYELQDVMQDLVGIARTQAELEQAVERIADLSERAATTSAEGNREYNPGWHTALDLPNLLAVAEAVARSAAGRPESRGAHSRVDHPEKDEQLGTVNTVVRQLDDESMETAHVPVVGVTEERLAIVKEMG